MDVTNLDKIIRLGTMKIGNMDVSVFCHVTYKDGHLSISGVEGPLRNGDSIGSFGQINMFLGAADITLAPKWTPEMLEKFFQIWDRWHLNYMRAGSPLQEKYLEDHKGEFPGYPISHYDWATSILVTAGLNPDESYLVPSLKEPAKLIPYKYGSRWLKETLPTDVLDFLQSLPDSDKTPAWV